MMRVPVRLLAGATVAAAVVLLALLAPVVTQPLAVVGSLSEAPLYRPPADGISSDWIERVRQSLETMRLPIRGERLDTLLRSVDRASTEFDVDPVTVLAVILVESRFDSGAVSPRGAMGLMQLRADTARELAGELGVRWTSDDVLLDPDVNVLLGTYYLSVLRRRFGDQDAAFEAFHSGPGRVMAGEVAVPREYPERIWDAVVRLRIRPFA